MTGDRLLLVGCGVLRTEMICLIEKNDWPIDTLFLDSKMHCNYEALEHALTSALAANRARDVIVFYGCCHPLIENMLACENTFRTAGQNCIDMLLGREMFDVELAKGAFFLLEDWAWNWKDILTKSFGTCHLDVIKEIFRSDRKYLLCIRTPSSADFTSQAEKAGEMIGLPLRWIDVALDRLETVLYAAITKKMELRLCPK
jgi:hypothetical protein